MGWDESLRDSLSVVSGVSPGQWCQAFFLFAAIGVGTVAAMPRDAKTLLVDYGARKAQKQPEENRGRLVSLIATLTSWAQVPHSWFGAFYLMSVALSVFWLAQYLYNGAVLRLIASRQVAVGAPSATLGQVELGWLMLFLQGVRRAFEHATVFKPSKSTMWVVHWLLGLFFYLFISVSIWVEGSGLVLVRAGHCEVISLTVAQRRS